MKNQKTILFIIPILIISILGIIISISKYQSKLFYCDPVTPRGNDLAKWNEIITPKTQNTPYDSEFFDKIEISSNNEEFTLTYPDIRPPEYPFACEHHELVPGEPLEIGDGTLNFYGMGIAYPKAKYVLNDELPYKFFDANLQPENEENINTYWENELSEQDSYFKYYPWPRIKLGFEYKDIEDLQFNSIRIFDARTHRQISLGLGGKSKRADEGYIRNFSMSIPLWHRTPIDLVMDISFGPSKIFEFPPKAGQGFKTEGFECRLIDVLEDIYPNSYSETRYDNKNFMIYPKAREDKTGTRLLFACLPKGITMPATFELLDKNGNKVPSGAYGSTTEYIRTVTLKDHQFEDIANIRVTYRTNRYRFVIHLPYFPGLPEQNNNIDNLFDVYLPYVKIEDESRLKMLLYETLQLNTLTSNGFKPSNNNTNIKYPIVFTDTTLRDIAKKYVNKSKLNADIENDTLIMEPPVSFMTKMKMLFNRIRQKK